MLRNGSIRVFEIRLGRRKSAPEKVWSSGVAEGPSFGATRPTLAGCAPPKPPCSHLPARPQHTSQAPHSRGCARRATSCRSAGGSCCATCTCGSSTASSGRSDVTRGSTRSYLLAARRRRVGGGESHKEVCSLGAHNHRAEHLGLALHRQPACLRREPGRARL